jgi:formylglycine-generating enzyme required for sulfatase activity
MTTPIVTRPISAAGPALVAIPAGWFTMGHPQGLDCEQPAHRVWVDGFWLGRFQVTNAEYEIFLADTKAAPPPLVDKPEFSHPRQPVVGVSWFQAVAYCEWLAAMTGRRYRLPTEAEWERAARGGREGELHPWGSEPPQSRPGYETRWVNGPEVVGGSAPNVYGLHDMCENVHEWCADWFDADFYKSSPERNPRGPDTGIRRASRGGSWRHHVKMSCCHTRSSIPPELQYADYGFRVACGASVVG